jgi:hypothetical protein
MENYPDYDFIYQSHSLFQKSFQLEQQKYKEALKKGFLRLMKRLPQDVL